MLEALVQLVVFAAGVWVWLKARRAARAAQTAWRRRVGMLFFLAPFVVTVGRVLPLPDATKVALDGLEAAARGVDALLVKLVGVARENLSGFWLVAARTLIYAGVYGGLGVLVGWPLDKLLGPAPGGAGERVVPPQDPKA